VVRWPGQRHDSTPLEPVRDAISVPGPGGRARYRGRDVVEGCCNRRKPFRAVATRDDQRAVNYRAMVVIASLPART
jgi:hypothetical protein